MLRPADAAGDGGLNGGVALAGEESGSAAEVGGAAEEGDGLDGAGIADVGE